MAASASSTPFVPPAGGGGGAVVRGSSAIDAAYDVAATRMVRRRTGDLSEALLATSVSKAIRDNLREMKPDEMDAVRDAAGYTCRERLAERKQLNNENAAMYPCGKHFYSQLKEEFSCSESPKKVVAAAAAKVLKWIGGTYY